MRKLYKGLALALAVLLVSVNAYAMLVSTVADVKKAVDDSNTGRDHIDIIVRHYPNDNDNAVEDAVQAASLKTAGFVASEGTVVVWATHSSAVPGRDVTWTNYGNHPLVAGVISESGGIASGAYGRVRIYGYFDDVLCADGTDAVSVGSILTTATPTTLAQGNSMVGFAGVMDSQVGASGVQVNIASPSVGVALGAGSGGDGNEIPVMINVR